MCAAFNPDHALNDRALARRQQVLDAAAECFRRKGFHGASMAEIAKTAGMSPGHIYNLFENKDDVITAIVERDRDEIVRRIQETLDGEDVTSAMLGCIEESFQEPNREAEAVLNIEVLAEASRNPKLAEVVVGSETMIRNKAMVLIRMALGPAADSLPADDIEARATVVGALFNGLMVLTVSQPDLNQLAVTRVMQRVMRVLIEP
ncbi:TetR/AcrR family transcriptional regulator [Aquabacterium parvum]|uniref:TetR/AcrR family transcriptional regulator n=1 Tax=Aquabacterium parvum TaxID=70584 RepID=UPI000718E79B|nr:TetR/AcrR family transcriptional regulator [Aquabacterium parvum]MBU0917493.1 TetR/AcrR family transcriptional regulator [Gammaproteobacteria bacterium]